MAKPTYNASATSPNYSNELVQIPPIATTYQPLMPNQQHGRKRVVTFTVPLLAQAQNAVIGLCNIPKNARVFKSIIMISAGPGANVNFDIGLAGNDNNGNIDDGNDVVDITGPNGAAATVDTANFFGNFAPANAAAVGAFADTIANNCGYMLNKDCILTTTVKTAAVSGAATLYGYVEYVTD